MDHIGKALNDENSPTINAASSLTAANGDDSYNGFQAIKANWMRRYLQSIMRKGSNQENKG